MKPFDLEAAKRGEPIVTRNGTLVEFIAHVPKANSGYNVIALVEGITRSYFDNGNWIGECTTHLDLFMAPKKKTVWVNLYNESFRPRESISSGYAYETEMLANANSEHTRIGGKAWPVEIEE